MLASQPIATALENLLREHTHIALVRDNDGLVVGMITLEDIVEELIGDIQGEYDLLPAHIIRLGNGWVVGGGTTLARLKEITGIDLPPGDKAHNLNSLNNLNRWMSERIGGTPSGGEVVTEGDIRLLVRKVRRQRVLEAALSVDARAASPHQH